jgi:transcription initiation factor TFIIB
MSHLTPCSECGCTEIIYNVQSGDEVCTQCGLVVQESCIDQGCEWREFENDPSSRLKSRVSIVSEDLLDTYGMHTFTGSTKLDRINIRTMDPSKRSLCEGIKKLKEMTSSMGIVKRIESKIKGLYKELEQKGIMKRRQRDAFIAACIYTACKMEGEPRTLREICGITRVPNKKVSRCCRLINKTLDINDMNISPCAYLSQFCGNLGIAMPIENKARSIITKAMAMGLFAGKSPTTIAASVIYFVTNNGTQHLKEYADVSSVTKVSLPTIKINVIEIDNHIASLQC